MGADADLNAAPSSVDRPSLRVGITLAVLFAAAAAIRLVNPGNPPFDGAVWPQLTTALIARNWAGLSSYSLQTIYSLNDVPNPHLVEGLAALVYRVTGGESFAALRALSTLFWLAGGAGLLGLVCRLTHWAGATSAQQPVRNSEW